MAGITCLNDILESITIMDGDLRDNEGNMKFKLLEEKS